LLDSKDTKEDFARTIQGGKQINSYFTQNHCKKVVVVIPHFLNNKLTTFQDNKNQFSWSEIFTCKFNLLFEPNPLQIPHKKTLT